jgi:hypothetical protein
MDSVPLSPAEALTAAVGLPLQYQYKFRSRQRHLGNKKELMSDKPINRSNGHLLVALALVVADMYLVAQTLPLWVKLWQDMLSFPSRHTTYWS